MNRVGVTIVAGMTLIAGGMLAAARWAPGTLQPAGAKAELSKLMARGVQEFDSVFEEWSAPQETDTQVASDEPINVEPVAEPVPVPPSMQVCELTLPQALGSTGTKVFTSAYPPSSSKLLLGTKIIVTSLTCTAKQPPLSSKWVHRSLLKS